MENKLLTWLSSLTITEHREAVQIILTRFEINRATLYNWKKKNKKFSPVEIEELNKIASSINNSKIF